MKISTLILIAGIFSMATATARPLTSNEIFSAIDGEHNHVAGSAQRVNFDMSAQDFTGSWSANEILSGIDGEYDHALEDASRVNYSLASSHAGGTMTVNEVLSGIDGEYYQ